MAKADRFFWKTESLATLNQEQWESLCDGCAKCCLHRLEDTESHEIYFTNVCCRYLDLDSCRCNDYVHRSTNVPDCVSVTLEILQAPYWLPTTCAYRLLAEGRDLPWWHPLISGDPDTVVQSGNSVRGKTINELEAEDLRHHMVDWLS